MKLILAFSILMSSVGVEAGGTHCRALCETPWGVREVSEKGGETYFSARDVFSLLARKCYGELVSGYQRDPYDPWYTRPVYASVEKDCAYDGDIAANHAPAYSGRGVGY